MIEAVYEHGWHAPVGNLVYFFDFTEWKMEEGQKEMKDWFNFLLNLKSLVPDSERYVDVCVDCWHSLRRTWLTYDDFLKVLCLIVLKY